MTTFSFESTVQTTATPKAIYALYADPVRWNTWDDAIVSVELDGPFAAGTTGRMTMHGDAPPLSFRFVAVTPDVGFIDETIGPAGALIRFEHEIAKGKFTHRLQITGGSPGFAAEAGRMISEGMPHAMKKLAALAESRS